MSQRLWRPPGPGRDLGSARAKNGHGPSTGGRQEGREMQWYRPAKGDGEGPVDGTWCSRPGGSWSYPGLVSDPIQKTGEKSGVCQARTFFLL